MTREYICVECNGRDFEPHQGRDCRHCGRWHCLGCLPDHEAICDRAIADRANENRQSPNHPIAHSPDSSVDRNGLTAERRAELLTGYYLEETHLSRAGKWDRVKIQEWAAHLWIPLPVLRRGICDAVDRATSRGDAIYAFGYVEPHIIAAAKQYREASAGLGPSAQSAKSADGGPR